MFQLLFAVLSKLFTRTHESGLIIQLRTSLFFRRGVDGLGKLRVALINGKRIMLIEQAAASDAVFRQWRSHNSLSRRFT